MHRNDLKSIWDKNYIQTAFDLNEGLKGDKFHDNTLPMYFTGKRSANTVMVMLNPGYNNPKYDFSKTEKIKFETFEQFEKSYIESLEKYGINDIDRLDNFDLKQAAFLYYSKDEMLKIPRDFWKNSILKKEAKCNVLMNKYQLEFIPYCSRKFEGVMSSQIQAFDNFKYLEPYLLNVLTEINSFQREYIIFCSKQFVNLFNAAEKFPNWNGVFELLDHNSYQEGKLTLSCSKFNINLKGKKLQAIVPHSFASQALPNAFEKMSRYGLSCLSMIETLKS